MRSATEWFRSSQPALSMLLVQAFATGMQLFSRIILVQGTFIFALVAYRHIVATICVAPFAFYFERGRVKNLSWTVWFWLFLNALFGIILAMGLFYYGLRDTSATYSVNFLNLIPIFTFLVSIICRMEKLGLQTWAGKAKTLGAILCVGGALTTCLYQGKEFYIGHHSHDTQTATHKHEAHMLRGTLFLVASCFSYTAWYIVQVKLMKVFPLKYWSTMLTCIIASIQAAVVGSCIDSSKAAWALGWNLQLVTILYSGALATAAIFSLVSWAIAVKGPTFPSMFNPLSLIFVAILEAILLGEPLSVGKVLGMFFIILGLYCFLWGKQMETRSLPQPSEATVEVEVSTGMAAESVGRQSTAVVAPSSSPNNTVVEIERTDVIRRKD